MSDLLDKLESALQEVEEQLLAEFERIRKSLSGEPYSSLDSDVQNALNEIVTGLWQELENIGDRNHLTLRTERQEKISFRMIVVKKLLDAKIPTAYLADAQEEIEESLREAETRSSEDVAQTEVTIEEPIGFLETIMQFFRGKPAADGATRSGINITEVEESGEEKVEIYLDSVYAAQHLAVIALRFRTRGDDKDMMNAAVSGKAVFESRDLSDSMPKVSKRNSSDPEEVNQKKDLAQTPDAIRKKLESTVRRTGGASTFESRELSATIPPMPSVAARPVAEKKPPTEKRDFAQTPDEIRKKLEARQGDSSSSGKASFSAKDIEHATPRVVPRKVEKEPVKEEPPERPTGKAVFESKDLSSTDEK